MKRIYVAKTSSNNTVLHVVKLWKQQRNLNRKTELRPIYKSEIDDGFKRTKRGI